MVAQTLVEAGVEVTMVDTGVSSTKETKLPVNKNFLELRKNDKSQFKYFIGNRGQGISWGDISKGAQVTPPREYMTKLTETYIPLSSKNFSPVESLGYGGLGIGWGLQCWEYSDSDLKEVGLNIGKIRDAYEVVGRRIGISATRDTAAKYTIGSLGHFDPSAATDKNHRLIQKVYKKHEKKFIKKGIYVGRTPLALITQPRPGRKAYRYLDTDFYSDNDKSAWRPWITIDALRKQKNFTYMGNLLVTTFEEKDSVVTVTAIDTTTGEKKSLKCKNLILSSGALGTARIALRSFKKYEVKIPLLSNPHSYIPCVQPSLFGKGYESKKLGFGQLSYFIDAQGDDSEISVASSYGYQSLMLFRIIAQMPFNFFDGRILSRYLVPGLVIMIAQHPDRKSPKKYLQLIEDTGSSTGDYLDAHYELSKKEEQEWDTREKAYMSAMRKLHTFAIKQVKTEHGSGIHYAGTLPFSNQEEELTLDVNGRLHKTKHVYVADSSGFRFLPAKGLTFTLMANAHTVALNVLKENGIS